MNIVNHRLEGAEYVESPNQGGPYAPSALDTIIIHFTAGANVESAIRTLCDVERRVSAHLVVASPQTGSWYACMTGKKVLKEVSAGDARR